LKAGKLSRISGTLETSVALKYWWKNAAGEEKSGAGWRSPWARFDFRFKPTITIGAWYCAVYVSMPQSRGERCLADGPKAALALCAAAAKSGVSKINVFGTGKLHGTLFNELGDHGFRANR
jgi:hypothetical protein